MFTTGTYCLFYSLPSTHKRCILHLLRIAPQATKLRISYELLGTDPDRFMMDEYKQWEVYEEQVQPETVRRRNQLAIGTVLVHGNYLVPIVHIPSPLVRIPCSPRHCIEQPHPHILQSPLIRRDRSPCRRPRLPPPRPSLPSWQQQELHRQAQQQLGQRPRRTCWGP